MNIFASTIIRIQTHKVFISQSVIKFNLVMRANLLPGQLYTKGESPPWRVYLIHLEKVFKFTKQYF